MSSGESICTNYNYKVSSNHQLLNVKFAGCSFAKYANCLDKEDIKTLSIGKLLGSGGFGAVYEGFYKGRKVAVKKLHFNRKNPHAITESFVAEVSVASLRHKNIVRVLAVSALEASCRRDVYIVMEYAGNRNLHNVIDCEKERITDTRRDRYAVDIASALSYIHQRRVAHLDLKPANILVTCQDSCKLGDFGCSKILPEDGQCSPATPTNSFLTGTLSYRAPELLKGEFPSSRADMYSYGICLWQLLTREKPYGSENLYVVIFGVVAYNLRPTFSKEIRRKYNMYVQLCEALWKAEPSERPDASAVLRVLRTKLRKKSLGMSQRQSWRT